MSSIGYDLVDLSLTDPSRTERLAAKFMNAAELDAPGFLSFHHYCWLCWSIKEAVYKHACRMQPGLVFSPARIVVTGLSESLEAIAGGVRTYSRMGGGVIETVACGGAFASGLDPDPHARAVSCAGEGWAVKHRSDGCPSLLRGNEVMPVSFSHHGAFAGFALVLP